MRSLAILLAAASVGAVATPAAAQYNPQQQQVPQPYPGQPGYGYPQQGYPQQTYPQGTYQQQGGIGGLIGQLLGGRRYAANDQQLVGQCAAAAQNDVTRRAQATYGQQGYNQQRYDPRYGQQGYNQQAYGAQARVTAITNVERRGRNNLRVTGLIDSGMNGYGQQPYGNAYGYNQNQNQAYAQQGDMRFVCTVDTSGRVTNLRLNRVR
jgi:hypothetical protein